MAEQSQVSMVLEAGAFSWLPGALEYAAAGHIPGGTSRNRGHLGARVVFADDVAEPERSLLYDPQTSGGLLVSIGAESLDSARRELAAAGVPSYVVGRVVPPDAQAAGLIVEA
jgi:selenide,water dikinase